MAERIGLALIGGSGFYQPGMLDRVCHAEVETPYGKVALLTGEANGKRVAFLARHGATHSLLPHQLNYRANLWALKSLGVQRILATTAVGSLQPELGPGSLVAIDQFLDFTKQRPLTFFEEGEVRRAHIDMTEPYCPMLREELQKAAVKCGMRLREGGCYVCTEGPRYETAAEIRMFRRLGGDLVGMTGVPEVVLARELGICYANLSIVTNFAAGINPQPLNHGEVVQVMNENREKLRTLILDCLLTAREDFVCSCRGSKES